MDKMYSQENNSIYLQVRLAARLSIQQQRIRHFSPKSLKQRPDCPNLVLYLLQQILGLTALILTKQLQMTSSGSSTRRIMRLSSTCWRAGTPG